MPSSLPVVFETWTWSPRKWPGRSLLLLNCVNSCQCCYKLIDLKVMIYNKNRILFNLPTLRQSILAIFNSYWMNALNGSQVNTPRDFFMSPHRYCAHVASYGSIIEVYIYRFFGRVSKKCLRVPFWFLQSQNILDW